MAKQTITPAEAAQALLQASRDLHDASDPTLAVEIDAKVFGGIDKVAHATREVADGAQCLAAMSLARALKGALVLRRRNEAFDFGLFNQAMLEYLPKLVLGDVTASDLRVASEQVATVARQILVIATPTPKPLDFPHVVPPGGGSGAV